jgi:integrase
MARRRGNQEGSIYKRSSGNWQAQVSIDGRRLAKTFSSRLECQTWLQEISARKGKGLTFKRAKITYSDFVREWFEVAKAKLRPATVYQYEWALRLYLFPEIGSITLSDITPVVVQSFYSKLFNRGVSNRTVQAVHAILRRSLHVAERQGLLLSNAAKAVDMPSYEKPEMAVLSDNQVRSLLAVADKTQMGLLIQLAVTTGMRKGELLGLKWCDVDWATSTVKVQRQLQRVARKGLLLVPPKTTRGTRSVHVGSETLRKLMNHHEGMSKRFPSVSELTVFCSSIGTPMEPRNLLREFKALLKKSGLPNVRFHDLRHTAASIMLSNGMPVIKIARQLGHAKASTTLDIYGHIIPGLEVESVERIDALLNPTAAELQQISGS